jgi:hypothetical protein
MLGSLLSKSTSQSFQRAITAHPVSLRPTSRYDHQACMRIPREETPDHVCTELGALLRCGQIIPVLLPRHISEFSTYGNKRDCLVSVSLLFQPPALSRPSVIRVPFISSHNSEVECHKSSPLELGATHEGWNGPAGENLMGKRVDVLDSCPRLDAALPQSLNSCVTFQ